MVKSYGVSRNLDETVEIQMRLLLMFPLTPFDPMYSPPGIIWKITTAKGR
jgi:hypothetical protein